MFLFPGAFPETFGISTLESLTYNTPLVATRFGALEETAIDQASYFLDYAIEPNGLFPNIDLEQQCERFAGLVINAYNNPYLHQQKQYYCNVIKDIHTWDTVALQWKQHFVKQTNLYLSKEEFKKVSYINQRVHKVYGRRFSNKEEWGTFTQNTEQHIAVITPFYNAEQYILRCIDSVVSQNYSNWKMYLINDASTDGTKFAINHKLKTLPEDIRSKIEVITNTENKGAVYNQIGTLWERVIGDDTIVMLLDGDDALVNDNNIFNFYNNLYSEGNVDYSYGSCWSEVDNIPLIAQPYPKHVRDAKLYRKHKFNWGMPYPHLRTFRRELLNNIDVNVFKDPSTGEWFKAGGDNATFYNIIEQADPNKIKVVQDIVMLYNDKNPLNDYKVHGDLQNKNASKIAGNPKIQINKKEVNA
jgi:glycosyltransferase involved in cell wall biosynthesis